MLHQEIDQTAAMPIEQLQRKDEAADAKAARFSPALLLCALPFILLGLLVRLVWDDVTAVVRGIGAFHQGAADQLSRRS